MDVLHANAESFKYFYRNALKVKIGINTTILDVIVFCCFLGILFIFLPTSEEGYKSVQFQALLTQLILLKLPAWSMDTLHDDLFQLTCLLGF